MKMKKEQKIELVKALQLDLDKTTGLILTHYKGLTYLQMDSLRRTIKESGSTYRVIKNTLLSKALVAKNIDLSSMLVEPTACILIEKDFAATAKIVKKFTKDPEIGKFLVIKGGYFDGAIVDSTTVERIADLPSRDELLARALGSLSSPVTSFVTLLSNIPRSLLNVLNALKDKK